MPEAGHQAGRGLSDPRSTPTGSSTDELVEEVDADGLPIALITRAEMRATTARHRACYVVVHDGHGRVLVHQRAPWKDIWPNRWDLAFGGVCEPEESWAAAAVRELAEEAGPVVGAHDLVDLGPVRFDSAEARLVGRVYLVASTGPFTFPDGEVAAHDWVALDDLAAWAARTPVCADAAAVVLPLVRGATGARGAAGAAG